jgi:hypothetical protein
MLAWRINEFRPRKTYGAQKVGPSGMRWFVSESYTSGQAYSHASLPPLAVNPTFRHFAGKSLPARGKRA